MNRIWRTQIFITVLALVFALTHLLWPNLSIDNITIFLLAVAVLPWLIPLIRSVEGPGGWKLEFQELQQAKNEADKAGLLITSTKNGTEKAKRKSIKALPLYSFELVLDQDPNLALAGLRIELEKRLVQIATSRGLNVEKMGVGSLLRVLNQKQALSQEESSVLADMIGLLNSAVHGAKVDKRAFDWAVEIGPKLLQGLDEKIEKYK